ncbi:complement component-related sushi domain-containing [Holotrichia oblita]|uniref:Complement component-related sushi domain-containing n=1 Tax=Holotrichia oblita TaxID=644536 RepID=A0ACB9SS21_HOLOL|nr:complement component-related sushi domain-containing [Holotrichia oblita]
MYRAATAPKTRPLRQEDEVTLLLNEYEEKRRYKVKEISPDCPPIAGYTGHIPRVKGNEESLSQRYNTVVKRGFNILRQERQKRDEMKNIQLKITDIINEQEQPYIPKDS